MKVTFYSPCFSSIFKFIYSVITYSFMKNCRLCCLACLGDFRFPSGITSQFLNRSKQDSSFQGLITTLLFIYLLHLHFHFQKNLYHLENKIKLFRTNGDKHRASTTFVPRINSYKLNDFRQSLVDPGRVIKKRFCRLKDIYIILIS